MYSVVMMMAMAGAPDAPAFGRNRGCDGGCQGQTAGCRGRQDNCGCEGGGRRARRDRGCGGGSGCGGYAASCGCQGYQANCCQQASYGCQGYAAGGYGQMMGGYSGCGAPLVAPPAQTSPPPAMPPKGKEAMIAAPATIVVTLPAEATLKIDGFATKQTSSVREFTTPTLAAGQSFLYTLTAEVVRDGKTVSSSQQIVVRAGETANVSLPVDTLVVLK